MDALPHRPLHRPLTEARLLLQSRDAANGRILATRRVRNTLMRSGAELVAGLFNGTLTTPVNALAVGLNPDPSAPPYEVTALTTTAGDGTTLLERPAAALAGDAFSSTLDAEGFRVVLKIHGVLPAGRAVSPDAEVDSVEIGEAALGVLAPDGETLARIYNRVAFEPLPKRRNHELAFYWEVDFPYGT